jgi:pyruvate dehydrogenase E1 component
VRSNGQIIQELERLFHAGGWEVINALWGSDWDPLFERDKRNALLRRFAATVDGKIANTWGQGRSYNLTHFVRY